MRPASSHFSAELQNARLRFLISTRAIYWELFESGFLDRDSISLLINASESEEEHVEHNSKHPLSDWNEDLKRFVRTPLLLRFLRRFRWLVFDGVRQSLMRWYEISHASRCVNVADAFTAAHRKVLGDLSGLLAEVAQNQANVHKLVSESFANVEQSKAVVRSFPLEVVSVVRTRQATSLLLSHQEETITTKFRRGIFTALEHDHLIGHIRKVRSQLVLRSASFHFPSEEGILRWSRLMEGLSVEHLQLCFANMQFVVKSAGDDVVKHGQECDGIYIILRGYAYFHVPKHRSKHGATTHGKKPHKSSSSSAKHADYLMAGRTMGIIETVSGQNGACIDCVAALSCVGERGMGQGGEGFTGC